MVDDIFIQVWEEAARSAEEAIIEKFDPSQESDEIQKILTKFRRDLHLIMLKAHEEGRSQPELDSIELNAGLVADLCGGIVCLVACLGLSDEGNRETIEMLSEKMQKLFTA